MGIKFKCGTAQGKEKKKKKKNCEKRNGVTSLGELWMSPCKEQRKDSHADENLY